MDRLTALRVFVSVVEQGSLSGAGEKLDMSRAMVSLRLPCSTTLTKTRNAVSRSIYDSLYVRYMQQ